MPEWKKQAQLPLLRLWVSGGTARLHGMTGDEFDALYEHALPEDAPGAWIRAAIERERQQADAFDGRPASVRADDACICAVRGYCADVADDPLGCPVCVQLGELDCCPATLLILGG